jgi:LuxR family maltose regulon positive regulatory protein
MAQGNFTEALVNIQSIRALHLRRPSGQWKDQDLLAYEAFIYIRMGDLASAEQHLDESDSMGEHGLSQLARAEILLLKNQPDVAEKQLSDIVLQYPHGIQFEPLMRTRVLLARSLFDQHKVNQALQIMKEAIRLAAPERFFAPFLEGGLSCLPLLSLALQTESLTSESQSFIKELLRRFEYTGEEARISEAEIETLSASASISPREQEVLGLISAGYSNREIAGKLSISESTVKTHVGNIYHKLNVNSRVQAITCAKELKLV